MTVILQHSYNVSKAQFFLTSRVVSPKPEGLRPVEPLAPARYKIQFTASAELHAKLERLRALMPDGDLLSIIDQAVTEKLERLESKRFAKTKAPRKCLEETETSPSSRYVPAAVKRAVRERDGDRCAFVKQGRRCAERARLQFHHRQAYARGGDHSPERGRPQPRECRADVSHPQHLFGRGRVWKGSNGAVPAHRRPRA